MFFKILVLSTIVIGLTTGCSSTHRASHSARTATEQLLISEAIIRSLPREPNGPLPISKDSKIILDISGLTPDQSLLQQVLTGWLGQQGYLVQKEEKNATHRISVIVGALGTELAGTFFGMPPVQSVLIPFSLPELSLYKAQHQVGYVKFHMNIFEIPEGRLVGSTPTFLADTYYSDYTVLFLLSFTSTDLIAPPQTGSFHRNPLNALDIRMEEAKFWTGKENSETPPMK
ncbi:hypothetical protein SAMN05216420_101203 [Nitrosospira sp. Nl5]|nr:hypothetical protein SAMN05216420_101203 [Nitrosospira sp. Nl5]